MSPNNQEETKVENGVAEKNNDEIKNKSKVASTLVFYVNGKCNYF